MSTKATTEASIMKATCFVLAISRFDPPERWIVILLMSRPAPIPAKDVLERLGPTSGHVVVRRALRRLTRDQVVTSVDRGLLQINDPWAWPAHRVQPEHLGQLEQLVGPTRGNDRGDVSDKQDVHAAIKSARHRAGYHKSLPKLHQADDDDPGDWDWLDGPVAEPDSVVAIKPTTVNHPTPTTRVEDKYSNCESCANAIQLLSSPLTGFREWAHRHLQSCPRSPKAHDGR
jgi:hypothetical protein